MRDEKGKFLKFPSVEDNANKIKKYENTNTSNTYSFNIPLNLYYLFFFSVLLFVGYFIWSRILFLYVDMNCKNDCIKCDLNKCYDSFNCFCRECLDCLREFGFSLYMF